MKEGARLASSSMVIWFGRKQLASTGLERTDCCADDGFEEAEDFRHLRQSRAHTLRNDIFLNEVS